MYRGAEVFNEPSAGRCTTGHAAERRRGSASQDEERGLPVPTVRRLQVSALSQQLQPRQFEGNGLFLHCRDALESVTLLYNQVEEKLHTLVMKSNESLQHLDFLFRLRKTESNISTVQFLSHTRKTDSLSVFFLSL